MNESFMVALKDKARFGSVKVSDARHIGFTTYERATRFDDILQAEQMARFVERYNGVEIEVLSEDEARQRVAVAENTHRLDLLFDERHWSAQQEAEDSNTALLKQLERGTRHRKPGAKR